MKTVIRLDKVSKSYTLGEKKITALKEFSFEVKSGDRMELAVTGKEYGQMVEGDVGELSFQGTRFLGFERN